MNVIKNISANNLNVSHFCVNLVALSLMLLYAIFVLPVLREGIEKIKKKCRAFRLTNICTYTNTLIIKESK